MVKRSSGLTEITCLHAVDSLAFRFATSRSTSLTSVSKTNVVHGDVACTRSHRIATGDCAGLGSAKTANHLEVTVCNGNVHFPLSTLNGAERNTKCGRAVLGIRPGERKVCLGERNRGADCLKPVSQFVRRDVVDKVAKRGFRRMQQVLPKVPPELRVVDMMETSMDANLDVRRGFVTGLELDRDFVGPIELQDAHDVVVSGRIRPGKVQLEVKRKFMEQAAERLGVRD